MASASRSSSQSLEQAASELVGSLKELVNAHVDVGNADIKALQDLNQIACLYVAFLTEQAQSAVKHTSETKNRLWEMLAATKVVDVISKEAENIETLVGQLEEYVAALEERMAPTRDLEGSAVSDNPS